MGGSGPPRLRAVVGSAVLRSSQVRGFSTVGPNGVRPMGERRSPSRIYLSLSAGESDFWTPMGSIGPICGLRWSDRIGPEIGDPRNRRGWTAAGVLTSRSRTDEGFVPAVPLRRPPQKPSRGADEPPIDDKGKCRGTDEGAANPCPKSRCLFPGVGDPPAIMIGGPSAVAEEDRPAGPGRMGGSGPPCLRAMVSSAVLRSSRVRGSSAVGPNGVRPMGERRSPSRIYLSLSAGERVDRDRRPHQPERDG
jgi:hypothetical protein